ncbi:hypothetical protein [Caenibius sp. WL]|uniref:hypothetical protein n=1 Tax=Caenibius sp. WL TaxID=2872646 RepID=UPI001C99996A|nr:hypothetical protein [Caenibius sp. WL]QZP09456.1 hypothetical protein K5X80_06835 [Caenibius sp. WL]
MSDLSNTPMVPGVSPRGWTPAARTRFLEHLALKGHVRAACAHVGLSAEAAYRLRRRDPLFARGWAAALVLAHDHGEQVLAARAIDGVEEPVYYRGEQVGTRRRYDTRLLLAHLARLDRMAENRAAQRDAGRFDDLLAVLAGAPCPEGLAGEDALPLPREQAIARAVAEAEQRLFHGDEDEDEAWDGSAPEDDADGADADESAVPLWQREDAAYFAVRETAGADAAAQWDAWCAEAYALVDGLATPEEAAVKAMGHSALLALRHPRAGGDPEATAELDSRLRGNDERGEGNGAEGAIGDSEGSTATVPSGVPAFTPCTVSTVSTSALARIIAGPTRGFAVADHPAFHARERR